MADPSPNLFGDLENLVVENDLSLPSTEVVVAFRNGQIGEISFKCLISSEGVVSLGEKSFNTSFFIGCLMSRDAFKVDFTLKFYEIFLQKANNDGFPEKAILIVVKNSLKNLFEGAIKSQEEQSKKLKYVCTKIVNNMEQRGINYPPILNSITSPSFTAYSLPSCLTRPFSIACFRPPQFTKSSKDRTSAFMNFFSKSV